MQFTYPELLWALFLLLIPLLVHLFQLRRFKRTPFTNVKLLKKVVSESRRSRNLKKWLLLATRCLLVAAVVLAFAQPFYGGKEAFLQREDVIYLDNSFSMQARNDDGSLLENAVQELQKEIPESQVFSLFTNDRVYEQVHMRDIRNDLLALPSSNGQLTLEGAFLKGASLFRSDSSAIKNLILISDFQASMGGKEADPRAGFRSHLVQLRAPGLVNASVDSAFISSETPTSLELTARLSSNAPMDALPVSLYNADTLIAKTAAIWGADRQASVLFTLPAGQSVIGRIEISDAQLAYDNQLYFTLEPRDTVHVLSVGSPGESFLDRIFTNPEFYFQSVVLENLNYSSIPRQNLIVLNELEAIPTALRNALDSYREDGGNLVVIPAPDAELASYNELLGSFSAGNMGAKVPSAQSITGISFSNPLYAQVFTDKVTNFQYPEVAGYYRLAPSGPNILSLQSGEPFLAGGDGTYIFASPLSGTNSSFRNSPLIVPTFYNMGIQSLRLPQLYYQTGKRAQVDIPVALGSDRILKVRQGDYEFIPMQRSFARKTTLTFLENPDRDGPFVVTQDQKPVQRLSFNYARDESDLRFMKIDSINASSKSSDLARLFETLENEGSITALWKWFVILALLCMLAELLIQKLLK